MIRRKKRQKSFKVRRDYLFFLTSLDFYYIIVGFNHVLTYSGFFFHNVYNVNIPISQVPYKYQPRSWMDLFRGGSRLRAFTIVKNRVMLHFFLFLQATGRLLLSHLRLR